MKIIAVVLFALVGSILLGLSVESFGEGGHWFLRFVGIMSLIASFRLATHHKKFA
ncbi:hypothetical protein [Pseudalkalibacillus hwajinpoensis]|uniref:hypothetical protein n=1 Tax=Guptibacillus hwajinpoensis TaxID=208199 RepID=UPI001CFDD6ED|nr:hypothetical protein [Pseudalkalibacillus hwajinpoensis]